MIEVKVPGHVCYGWDDGSTAMLCASQLCQIRHSCENVERCTAVLTGFMMVFSVCMPHGGYDEEDYTTDSEVVKIIMDEEDGCERLLHWRRSHH